VGHTLQMRSVPEAGHPCGQVDGAAVHAQPRRRDLGLRLPPGHGRALPPTLCVLRDRARVAPGGARRGDAPPDRRLGHAATPRGPPSSTSSTIATASTGWPWRVWPRQRALWRGARPIARPSRTRLASASSAACGANARTISWS
jgi:hypothetical protein